MTVKHILMIGTGGTIASEKTPSGLTPELNTEQLLSFIIFSAFLHFLLFHFSSTLARFYLTFNRIH